VKGRHISLGTVDTEVHRGDVPLGDDVERERRPAACGMFDAEFPPAREAR
jgi:hypothetical protein